MASDDQPGVGTVLACAALVAGAGLINYIVDKKKSEEEDKPFDNNSLPVYLGAGAAIGAVLGTAHVLSERTRQNDLEEWHKEHPKMSRTVREIEKNPRARQALKQYAKLTSLGD